MDPASLLTPRPQQTNALLAQRKWRSRCSLTRLLLLELLSSKSGMGRTDLFIPLPSPALFKGLICCLIYWVWERTDVTGFQGWIPMWLPPERHRTLPHYRLDGTLLSHSCEVGTFWTQRPALQEQPFPHSSWAPAMGETLCWVLEI